MREYLSYWSSIRSNRAGVMLCTKMIAAILCVVVLSVVNDVQSRYVRHPEIHRSVQHKKVIATWDEAKRRCEAEGAVMASPLDEDMVEYMRSSIGVNNHTTPYFIGFRATVNPELIFASVEGVPLDDLPEAAINMIDQLDPQDGDCLGMGRQNIRVVSCRARLPYICYKNDTSASTTITPVDVITPSWPEVTTPTSGDCSIGYTSVSGRYYKVHNGSLSWDNAQSKCTSEGGYLAVINNAQEAEAIKNYAFNLVSTVWILVGVRDRDENGNWRSVLGEPLEDIYHNWASSRTGYFCGAFKSEGTIDDMKCTYEYPFICEKECSLN